MTHILILESNAVDIVKRRRKLGKKNASDFFSDVFEDAISDVLISVVNPYEYAIDDLSGIDGIVLTGSGVHWGVDAPEAAPLRKAGEIALQSGLPVYGSCNGLQLAAHLLGGVVLPSPKGPEIGIARHITMTEEGYAHRMLNGRREGFAAPCIHRDVVLRPPEDGVVLALNAHSPVQAMAYEKNGVIFWGTQYHPEYSTPVIADFILESNSLFASGVEHAEDLALAPYDEMAAIRLGTDRVSQSFPARTKELTNWLRFIEARRR